MQNSIFLLHRDTELNSCMYTAIKMILTLTLDWFLMPTVLLNQTQVHASVPTKRTSLFPDRHHKPQRVLKRSMMSHARWFGVSFPDFWTQSLVWCDAFHLQNHFERFAKGCICAPVVSRDYKTQAFRLNNILLKLTKHSFWQLYKVTFWLWHFSFTFCKLT